MTEKKLELVRWDAISREIETAKDIEVLLNMKDKLRAYQVLAEQSRQSAEVQAKIAIYKARADRKCGEWLKENVKHEGGNPNLQRSQDVTVSLSSIGVTKNESSRLQKIADIPDKKFEAILLEAEIETKKITNNMLVKIAKEGEKDIRKEKDAKARGKQIADIDIRRGDFKKVLSDVYDIDAIITDPPYPAEYLDCFSDLSLYASEHLKKSGWLVVYSGQYNLPEVIKRLSEHMTYVWTFCLYHVGKKQLVNGVNIMCGWKPVLVFSKGQKKMRFSVYDVIESEQREKHSHDWQQSESGVFRLVEAFSEPGHLVVDPFSGAGTFCKVAIENGRRAIGAEIR